MVVKGRHRQEIKRALAAKITNFVIFAVAWVPSAISSSAPPWNAEVQLVFDQALDETTMPDDSFETLIPFLHQWFQTSDERDEHAAAKKLSVEDLLESPPSNRGLLYCIQGRVQEIRAMRSPYQEMEEWFIRLSSGEPLALYVPAGQIEVAAGAHVEVNALFYKILKARAMDGQIRRYPVFLGGRVERRDDAAGNQMNWQRMDVLMLLGFMLLLAMVLVGVMLLARRQLPSERRKVVPMVDGAVDLPDDPAEALHELRSRAGGDQM
ncbi:MAG: hypothetical protein CMJ39_05385 [Phycisphaerae bacterium]|nr:hypothetical protein [Phycisphaerae bacterium]